MTLGILDWGVGGLFALRRARQRCPELDVVYLSDSGNVPYGKQDRRTLADSVGRAIATLAEQGATEVLVACHSASTALPDVHPVVPTRGVIDGSTVPPGRALVLGGRRTITSRAWHRALSGRDVRGRVAQPLSAHVEAGAASSEACLADLDRILAPGTDRDVVVLACTHYAALTDAVRQRMPRATVVDPAMAIVDGLALAPGEGRVRVYTTGVVPEMNETARRIGVPVQAARINRPRTPVGSDPG